MADVFKAYQFLNKSMNLNLTKEQIAGMEKMFKLEWMKSNNFSASTLRDVDNWEFFSYLTPRTPGRKSKRTKSAKK